MISWDDAVIDFERLVKYAAKTVYQKRDRVDAATGIDDLYQYGMIKLYDCWQRYKHLPKNEFKALFSTSLFRTLERKTKSHETYDIELTNATDNGHEDSVIGDLNLSSSVEELKLRISSPLAKAVLNELINPSPRTLFEVWADRARRDHIRATTTSSVNGNRKLDVKFKHIRSALGVTPKQFDNAIAEVKREAAFVFGR